MQTEYHVTYFPSSVIADGVSGWQGLRGDANDPLQVIISGTSGASGLLYVGSIKGGGTSYDVDLCGATSTSVYGPDQLPGGKMMRLVGSYKDGDPDVYNHGFVWEGTLADLPKGGCFTSIDYPGAKEQYAHSTMGGLVVGNADGPVPIGGGATSPIGLGTAYLYDVASKSFLKGIVFPGSVSNTAYGIWHNGGTSYTICGGYMPAPVANEGPLGRGYLVDYDSATQVFSNWTGFDDPSGGADVITHFQGISSVEPGVYTLAADSVTKGATRGARGYWVRVIRKDGIFDAREWVPLHYPHPEGITSANSVYGNQVVGIVIGAQISYQARIEGV